MHLKRRHIAYVIMAAFIGPFLTAGCPSNPKIKKDVAELRKIVWFHNNQTVPKPGLSPADQAKVASATADIDAAFLAIERLAGD